MNLRYLSVGFVVLAAACADEPAASNGGAAPDLRRELAALTPAAYAVTRLADGAVQVAQVGARETRCADGVSRAACDVAAIDLGRIDLTPEDEGFARAAIVDGKAIVVGKLVSRGLVATGLWLRRGAAPTLAAEPAQPANLFVLRDVREACTTSATCAWLRAEPLDGTRAAHVGNLDLSLLGGSLEPAEKDAITRGRLMAHGAPVGDMFVAASIYLPFPEVAARSALP